MWSTIANLKENLNQIALDVHGDDNNNNEHEQEEEEDGTFESKSNGRYSPSLLRTPPSSNGIHSRFKDEIEQYKAQVQRLQTSEAEIKALSVNYAALLKEKEAWPNFNRKFVMNWVCSERVVDALSHGNQVHLLSGARKSEIQYLLRYMIGKQQLLAEAKGERSKKEKGKPLKVYERTRMKKEEHEERPLSAAVKEAKRDQDGGSGRQEDLGKVERRKSGAQEVGRVNKCKSVGGNNSCIKTVSSNKKQEEIIQFGERWGVKVNQSKQKIVKLPEESEKSRKEEDIADSSLEGSCDFNDLDYEDTKEHDHVWFSCSEEDIGVEDEEQISRLQEEKGSLRKNLEANVWSASTAESPRTLTSKQNLIKATNEKSPDKPYGNANQLRTNPSLNHTYKGVVANPDALNNGIQLNGHHQGYEQELASVLEECSRSLETMQAKHDSEIKELRMELTKERDNSANIQLKLQEEDKMNRTSQKELHTLKSNKDQHAREMKEMQNELNEKISEIRRLQMELTRRGGGEVDETSESLKTVIRNLEQENRILKMEKGEFEAALKVNAASSVDESVPNDLVVTNKHSSNLNKVNSSKTFPGKEELEQSIQKLEKDLNGACQARDKAVQQLSRLKQHLLDKEHEESDKMDEDSRVIEELRQNCNYQRAHILHLEKALKQAIESQDEVKKMNSDELQKSQEVVNDLKQKLASCVKTIDAKHSELLNLQTALGQYYAESEAKERLERDLVLAREESAKRSELLKDAHQHLEMLKREKEEVLGKLSQTERVLSEGKHTLHKLEEDNMKLRRALEQSMTRLNRMSMDSDYFVDRRIVIKLLVTYFQRNHSKEVLDLMVRMLGFSQEDKQRIGVAQQGSGKGVVRGVLGLPGRLVGGILGGSSADGSSQVPSDNQSFADLWVDFLLKETEERERREFMETVSGSNNSTQTKSPRAASPVVDQKRTSIPTYTGLNASKNQTTTPPSSHRNMLQPEHSDTEFSTVPLTSSVSPTLDNRSRISRLLPRY
ncbi:hypothetical protein IFM89_029854 [Coptis chinensis]|uniref:Golgin candidate 4 n=1 Tax=Coptis chinensis TaxID=261450 RepID=A0A835HKM8_9MAGN|nr:hypothetical protein IFM89_029854 [Coptis chinensis]